MIARSNGNFILKTKPIHTKLIQQIMVALALGALGGHSAASRGLPAAPAPESSEWRMIGANAGHTAAVDCPLRLPLRMAWRQTAARLGAPLHSPAYLHPRALAAGTLLVEMDTPSRIYLVAMEARTGRVKWQRGFITPRLFEDAGLFPAVDDRGVNLYLSQGTQKASDQWNLSRLSLADGHLLWEKGPLSFFAACNAPVGYHTLFRPVVAVGSHLLVTPDFFGRPPLVSFDRHTGAMEWSSDAVGGDIPAAVPGGRLAAVALSADCAAGRPVLRTTLITDGSRGPATAGNPAGRGEAWAGGVWDAQVRWADPISGACCIGIARLRNNVSWPSASCILTTPGAAHRTDWSRTGAGSLNGVLVDGSLVTGQSVVYQGRRTPALWRVDLTTGHTRWAVRGPDAGTPLLAAPGLILGRGIHDDLVAWASSDGHIRWWRSARGLRDCIAGDGVVVISTVPDESSTAFSTLTAYD